MNEHPAIFSKSFIVICAINLTVITSYNLLFVIIAPFAAEQFKAPPNITGLVASIMTLGCMVGRFLTGGYIDKIGLKKVFFLGIVIYSISIALYFTTAGLTFLMVNRFVGGIGFGCVGTMTGTTAAHLLPPDKRGLGISYFSLSTILGLAAGPFLGLTLIQYVNYNFIFTLCLCFALLAFGMALFIKLRITPLIESDTTNKTFKLSNYIELQVLPLGCVVVLAGLCYVTVQAFISFYAKELQLMRAASIFFLVYSAVIFALRPITGRIFDRRGENVVMYPALAMMGIAFLLLSQTNSALTMLLAAMALGAGYGNFQSIGQAASLKMVSPRRFAQATSTFYIMLDLGIGLGPYLCGFLVPVAGYRGLYTTMAAISFGCLPLYFWLHGRKSNVSISRSKI